MKLLSLATIALALSTITACPNQDPYCLRCFSSVCIQCAGSYINQNGVCVVPLQNSTIANCLSYASSNSCLECNLGYRLQSNGQCSPVSNSTSCLGYDKNGECKFCPLGQLVYNNACSNDNKCNIQNCALCTYRYGLEICEYCYAGYTAYVQYDGSMKCIPQFPSLLNCRLAKWNDTTSCAACNYGFMYYNGFCQNSTAQAGLTLNVNLSSAFRMFITSFVFGSLLHFAF